MKKEELLQFVPNEEEKWASTHKIAQKSKQNDITVYSWLVELENMPRPLVKRIEFTGKNRRYRMWKKTSFQKSLVDAYLKIPPRDRSTAEHSVILRDKYWGNIHDYINAIINSLKEDKK
jgi:hypothetical protein